jgi:hypothetical protein
MVCILLFSKCDLCLLDTFYKIQLRIFGAILVWHNLHCLRILSALTLNHLPHHKLGVRRWYNDLELSELLAPCFTFSLGSLLL